jgi:hypothetical protein
MVNFLARPSMSTVDDAKQVHIDEAAFFAPATRVDVGICGLAMSNR